MDTNEIIFIGRELELDKVKDFLAGKENDGAGQAIFISGEGGIGKTRLLHEISSRIKKDLDGFTVHPIIDLDSRRFNSSEGINLAMIEALPEYEGFNDYFDQLENIRIIEKTAVSRGYIAKQKQELTDLFVQHYNHITEGKQVWLFDTVEKLNEAEEGTLLNKDIVKDWRKKFPRLKNTIFIFAGRNPVLDKIRKKFEKDGEIRSCPIKLKGFLGEESWKYLEEKEKQFNLRIEKEQAKKLIELTEGKPIYLDLAFEWFIQEDDSRELQSVIEKSTGYKNAFEEKLISKIRELRFSTDRVIFVLAHVHPLDQEGFNILFGDDKLVSDTFEGVQRLVYVKTLPNEKIKLHDEMQRIVSKYILDTVDKSLRRRQHYSQKILAYLQKNYNTFEEEYLIHSKDSIDLGDARVKLGLRIKREEERINLVEITNQLIFHSFYADFKVGKQKLGELIEELVSGRLTKPEVNSLLRNLNKISKDIPLDQDIDFAIDRARLQLYAGHEATFSEYWDQASIKQKIEMLVLRSNFLVRKGEISESIELLKQAEEINKSEKTPLYIHNKIRLDIELGWNNRLIGNLKIAEQKYQDAVQLILNEVGSDDWGEHEELAIRYGWTLNNLAFVLSDSNETRRDAVDYAYTAIEHWQAINHTKGLGAGHSVLGITYYRIDRSEKALKHFEKALEIFEELELAEWICQIHSWRGALYQDRGNKGDLDRAKAELEIALSIAEQNNRQIVPMTLNRLGRVYMSNEEWEKAFEIMQRSLKEARELPDYVYWLGSIGRLGYVLAEYTDSGYTVEDLLAEFQTFNKTIDKKNIQAENNSLGITQLAIARLKLATLDKDPKEAEIQEVVTLLEESIPLITEFGSYARTDIRSRLDNLQRGFKGVDPAVIHTIGDRLLGFLRQKISNRKYVIVMSIINKWLTWKND